MSAAELRAIQRKLDRWELDHLREHAAGLAEQLDEARERNADLLRRLDEAEDRAESWRNHAIESFNHNQALGAIGLSIDGALHVIPPTQ